MSGNKNKLKTLSAYNAASHNGMMSAVVLEEAFQSQEK